MAARQQQDGAKASQGTTPAGYAEGAKLTPALRAAGLALAQLMRVGMLGAPLEGLPALQDGATWENVRVLAKHDSVEAIAWAGLDEAARSALPEELRHAWGAAADLTLLRQLQFDVERERITARMEAGGLSWLPLKGVLIAGYYPQPGLRSMSDNDILYGFVEPEPDGRGSRIKGATEAERAETVERGTEEIVRIMKGLGYRGEHVGASKDDCFYKEPMFNFEMHRGLMDDMDEDIPAFCAYYENPWLRARQDGNEPLRFLFSPADEYLYFLAHAYKHFSRAGCGVRFIADEWVLLGHYGEALFGPYLEGELEKLGLAEFDRLVRDMAQAVFGGEGEAPRLTDDQQRLWFYLLGCGTYGTTENRVAHKLQELAEEGKSAGEARAEYLGSRFFPSYTWCCRYYPVLRGRKWLYPGFLVFRIVRGVVVHPGRLLGELRVILRR